MYCQKVIGDKDFSIEEWNDYYKFCQKTGIEFPKEDNKECEEQCLACILIVAERRIRTQMLIDKNRQEL